MYSFRECRIIMLNVKDDEISTSGNRVHRFKLYQNHKICNTPAIFSLCIALFAVAEGGCSSISDDLSCSSKELYGKIVISQKLLDRFNKSLQLRI